MSVMKCHECTGMVSTLANACPHCGAKRQQSKLRTGVILTLLTPVATIYVFGVVSTIVERLQGVASVIADGSTAPRVSNTNLCRAGIALTMGRPLQSLTGNESNGIVTVSYVRQLDSSEWSYRCRIEGDKIIWGNVNGRWRTGPADDILRYSVGASSLAVSETNSGEMIASELYPLNDL
jgi:hypothetical protein